MFSFYVSPKIKLKGIPMKKVTLTQKIVLGLGVAAALASNAAAAITPPTTDYSDIYGLAGVAVGVLTIVMLVRKALSFFK